MVSISSNALRGTNYKENRKKYNGKELQNKEFGDGTGLEWYDYGARMYDQQIGRWLQVDAAADKWNMYSPFIYAVNDPASIIDPDGRDAIYSYDEKTKTITVKATIYYKGKELPQGKEERAKFIDGLNTSLKEIFKDGIVNVDDAEYNIKFDVSAEINEDIKEEDLKAGENIMEVDFNKTKLPDGSFRAGLRGGGKSNMGYLGGNADNLTNVHEIGHMIGLKDRYTDYENASNTKIWRSIVHENYKDDLMGNVDPKLNKSHYENIVKYTIYKLNQGQRNLLPQYRSNSVNVIQNIDANSPSASAAADIPTGWRPRGVK